MRFPYLPLPTRRPVYPLGGIWVRHRPIIHVQLVGPLGARSFDCSLDPGTDDTLFPKQIASKLGIALTSPPDFMPFAAERYQPLSAEAAKVRAPAVSAV